MHRPTIRLLTVAFVLAGVVFGIEYGQITIADAGKMFAAVRKASTQKNTVIPPQPTVQELANGNKTYLVIPVHFADSSKDEQRTPTQRKAIFDKVSEAYREFSNERLLLNFEYAPPIELPRNLIPSPSYFAYASLGNIAVVDDAHNNAPSEYPAGGGEIDRAICETPNRIENYDGVIIFFEESFQRHRLVQRDNDILAGHESNFLRGTATIHWLETVDCKDSADSKTAWKGIAFIFGGLNGTDLLSDNELTSTITHELGHTLGFGHASAWGDEYGNVYDLMGSQAAGVHPGAYFKAIAGWVDNAMIVADKSDVYQIFPLEQRNGPIALYFGMPEGLGVQDKTSFIEFRQPIGRDGILPGDQPGGSFLNSRSSLSASEYGAIHRTALHNLRATAVGQCELVKGVRDAIVRVEEVVPNSLLTVRTAFLDELDKVTELACGVDLTIDDVTISPLPQVGKTSIIAVKIRNIGSETALRYRTVRIPQILSYDLPAPDAIKPGKMQEEKYSWTPRYPGVGVIDINIATNHKQNEYVTKNNAVSIPVTVKDTTGFVPSRTLPKKRYSVSTKIEGFNYDHFIGSIDLSYEEGNAKENTGSALCYISGDCGSFLDGTLLTVNGVEIDDLNVAEFIGFSGPCTGMTCSFTLTQDTIIGINVSAPKLKMSLSKSGNGTGTLDAALIWDPVNGNDIGGNCTATTCTLSLCANCAGQTITLPTLVPANTKIRVTAKPDADTIVTWTGCTARDNDPKSCDSSLPEPTTTLAISATFDDCAQSRNAQARAAVTPECAGVTLTKVGTGKGVVTSNEIPELDCDASCSTTSVGIVTNGKLVSFTATPSANNKFVSWGGDAASCGSSTSCTLMLNAGKSITAKFDVNPNFGLVERNPKGGVTQITYTIPNQNPVTVTCIGGACPNLPNPLPENTKLVLQMQPSQSNGNERLGPYRWDGQCSSSIQYNAPCTVTMPAGGMTVYVEFGWQWRVTISRGDTNGTVWVNSPDGHEGTVTCGTGCAPGTPRDHWLFKGKTVNVYASGNNDGTGRQAYRVSRWTGECTSSKVGYCPIVNRAASLSASFEKIQYNFTIVKDCMGSEVMMDGYFCAGNGASIDLYRNTQYIGTCNDGCAQAGPVSMNGSDYWRVEYWLDEDVFMNHDAEWCIADARYDCWITDNPNDPGTRTVHVVDTITGQNAYSAITQLTLYKAFRSRFSNYSRVGTTSPPTFKEEKFQFDTTPGVLQKNPPVTQSGVRPHSTGAMAPTSALASLSSAFSKLFTPLTTQLTRTASTRSLLASVLTPNGANLAAKDVVTLPHVITPQSFTDITAVVTNDGDTAYNDYFGVSLKIARVGASQDEYPEELYRYIPKLEAGGISQVRWNTEWIPAVAGDYMFTLCVDRFRAVTDTNPQDDCLAPFTVNVTSTTAVLRTGPTKANQGRVVKFINPVQDMAGVQTVRAFGDVLIGSDVTLRAEPNANMQFTGWSGEEYLKCRYPNGDRSLCTFTMESETRIFANFTPAPAGLLGDVNNDNKLTASDALAILKSAVGQAVNVSHLDRADVDCSGAVKAKDALVVLKASVGSIPTPLTCADAAAAPTGNLTTQKTGDGDGDIQATIANQQQLTTTITLTATPKTGSVFVGWEGDCKGTEECRVTVNGMNDANVRAQFTKSDTTTPPPPPPPPVEPPPPPPVTPPPPSTGDLSDLVVLGDKDFRITPSKPTAGRGITVVAKVQNQGKIPSGSFIASLRVDKGGDGMWDFAEVERIIPVKVNQNRVIKFRKSYVPTESGRHTVQVCADDGVLSDVAPIPSPIPDYDIGSEEESNEDNNCQSMTIDVGPARRKAAAAGALATFVFFISVPVGLLYFIKSRERMIAML